MQQSLSEPYITRRRMAVPRRAGVLEIVGRGLALLIAFGLVWIAGMCALAFVTRNDPFALAFGALFLIFAACIAWASE